MNLNHRLLIALVCFITFSTTYAAELKIFENKGKYGLVEAKTGKVILKAKYDSISSFIGNYAKIKNKDKYGIINNEGKIYLPCKYKQILLPVARRSVGKDYFFVSKNGTAYYITSDRIEYPKTWNNVIYGPDHGWYGRDDNGKWFYGINDPNTMPRRADFKGNTLRRVYLPNKYQLFNDKLYSPDGKVLAGDVANADTVNLGGNGFIAVSFSDSHKAMLIDLKSGTVWVKNQRGLNGYYKTNSIGVNYLLGVNNNNLLHAYLLIDGDDPLYSIKNLKNNLYYAQSKTKMLLPNKFHSIRIDKKAGDYKGETLWKVRLDSKEPISEHDLEDFVKYLSSITPNFVIESTSSEGRSLFGNKGNEIVHNNLDGVYTKNGFLRVKSGGSDKMIELDGSMPFSEYDNVWQSEKGNLHLNDYVISKGNKIGLYVDGIGEIIPPLYDNLRRQWGHILVYSGDYVGLYDDDGNKILEPKYTKIDIASPYLKNNYYFVKTKSGDGMILGHKGQVIIPAGQIDNVNFMSALEDDTWCKVYKNGKMGIVNLKSHKVVVPCAYEDNILFGDGDWPNEKIGVYRKTANGDVVDIWTMSGKKIASRFCPSNTPYINKSWIEKQLNTRLYYDW